MWTLPPALLVLVLGAPSDRLCVHVEPRAPVATADLVAAIQARIVQGTLTTVACALDEPARFAVGVRRHSPVSVQVLIRGRARDLRTVVTIDGLAPEEVAQYVAVTAVEAIRPMIDAPREPPTVPEEPVCPAATPCPEPRVTIERVSLPPRFGANVAAGMRFGLAPLNVDAVV